MRQLDHHFRSTLQQSKVEKGDFLDFLSDFETLCNFSKICKLDYVKLVGSPCIQNCATNFKAQPEMRVKGLKILTSLCATRFFTTWTKMCRVRKRLQRVNFRTLRRSIQLCIAKYRGKENVKATLLLCYVLQLCFSN